LRYRGRRAWYDAAMKQEIRTENAHPPIGPYSQGIR
jgi:hypothetical protein